MTTFSRVLDALFDEPSRKRGLVEGESMLCYGELPDLFDRLDEGPLGQTPPGCVFALECSQSLAGAALLLYMLHRERSLVCLPPRGARYRSEQDASFVPAFCRHLLRPGEVPGEVSMDAHSGFQDPPAPVGGEGPRIFLRTSGSTATPKIAVHPQDSLAANAAQCVRRWGLKADDRIAVPVPIFHMYGLGAALLPALLAGATVDLQSGVNILRYLQREQSFDPNVAFLTPALVGMFLRVRRNDRPYRFAVTAGDRIEAEAVEGFERRFGPLLNLYGSTEMGALAAPSPEMSPAERRAGSGCPMEGAEVRLADPETSAGGTLGRLQCRYVHGFAGYVDPEGRPASGDRLDAAGWFETGDLARIDGEGRIEVLGRIDHSTNRDGLLVLFADLERALESLDQVDRSVVVAGERGPRGPKLIGFCVPTSDGITAEQVRRCVRDLVPVHMVPEEIHLRASLPTLRNGKIDRRALARREAKESSFSPSRASASSSSISTERP